MTTISEQEEKIEELKRRIRSLGYEVEELELDLKGSEQEMVEYIDLVHDLEAQIEKLPFIVDNLNDEMKIEVLAEAYEKYELNELECRLK